MYEVSVVFIQTSFTGTGLLHPVLNRGFSLAWLLRPFAQGIITCGTSAIVIDQPVADLQHVHAV